MLPKIAGVTCNQPLGIACDGEFHQIMSGILCSNNNLRGYVMSEYVLRRIQEARKQRLTVLNLDSSSLTRLPTELSKLTWLKKLYISSNKITDLSPLSTLSDLAWLELRNNQITDISPLSNLLNLIWLDLNNNYISDLSPLANLTKLTDLSLDRNCISDVTPLAMLSKLTELSLYDNQIVNLNALSSLPNICQLELGYNEITDLTPMLPLIAKGIKVTVDYPSSPIDKISLYKNPLEKPPIHIIEQGNDAILTYLRNLQEQGEGKLNEAKLIIVGEPGAGKTSLMKKLLDLNYAIPQEEDSTLGIHVHEGWQFPHPKEADTTFSANIWDFGGQQIQYMTHQFFLTPGAVYVLVSANDRKETAANFPYWFKIIHLLGEEHGVYSPVVVVQNDKNEQFIQQFDEVFYRQRYPELHISKRTMDLSKSDDDFRALRTEIQKMLTNLPHVNDARPARWNDIRTDLRKLAKTRNHINFAEYAAICNQHEVKDEASQKLLSYYLHRLGSLLHFSDDPSLRDFIILNPQWAVDAVYSVLNDKEVERNDGYFTLAKLESLWKGKYDLVEQGKLLNLMKKQNFEVCYQVECKDNTYIAPQLLSDRRPFYEWNSTDTLKFRFQYKFMPEGIITRLIVRLNDRIAKGIDCDLVWRKGMVLKQNGCLAQVQEEENREGLKVIDITITGKVSERKYLLRTIRDEIEKLHYKWFRNIDVEQMIPCSCRYCTNPSNSNLKYFEFSVLQRAQERGKATVECDREFLDVPVSRLLDGVFARDEVKQLLNRRDMMTGTNISGITLAAGAQLIVGNENTQKANSDNLTITITADQRQIINTVLDEMLEHKLPKDITKAVVKMQDVADADKEKPTQETQSRLGKFYDGMKKLAGFTDDVNKIGGFVAKHQDDIGAVLTSIQNAI